MPRAKRHLKTGLFVGFIMGGFTSLLKQYAENYNKNSKTIDWVEVIVWGFIGSLISGFCSLLPDIFEPAYSPNHRGFFHSFTFSGILAITFYKVDQNFEIPIARKFFVYSAIVGYGSHLVLDSKTPAGLDII